jgi:hypothetical protein
MATSTDIIVELVQYGATFDPLTEEQVTSIICRVLEAPADQLNLTRVQREKLLSSAARWQRSLSKALNDADFCRAFESKISASSEFGDLYKKWDAAPFADYLGLPVAEQQLINLHSVCP